VSAAARTSLLGSRRCHGLTKSIARTLQTRVEEYELPLVDDHSFLDTQPLLANQILSLNAILPNKVHSAPGTTLVLLMEKLTYDLYSAMKNMGRVSEIVVKVLHGRIFRSLDLALDSRPTFSFFFRQPKMYQLFVGLYHLHVVHGIAHRDIKPE
jgi:serine/threonine protein kinase